MALPSKEGDCFNMAPEAFQLTHRPCHQICRDGNCALDARQAAQHVKACPRAGVCVCLYVFVCVLQQMWCGVSQNRPARAHMSRATRPLE